jgi:hypothetical protein
VRAEAPKSICSDRREARDRQACEHAAHDVSAGAGRSCVCRTACILPSRCASFTACTTVAPSTLSIHHSSNLRTARADMLVRRGAVALLQQWSWSMARKLGKYEYQGAQNAALPSLWLCFGSSVVLPYKALHRGRKLLLFYFKKGTPNRHWQVVHSSRSLHGSLVADMQSCRSAYASIRAARTCKGHAAQLSVVLKLLWAHKRVTSLVCQM